MFMPSSDNEEQTVVHLVNSKQGVNIYRQGRFGYKVLMCPEEDAQQPSPSAPVVSEEQILKLVKEQTISRYLSHGCNKRRVVDVKGFKGNPSLYFEWVEGITLGAWMGEHHHNINSDVGGDESNNIMEQRLKVAMSIAKSLHDFHSCGVAYNFLTLDHIVLQWNNNNNFGAQDCAACFINLSRAVVLSEVSQKAAKEAIRKDLNDLGLILDALLRGDSDVSSSVERRLSDETNSSGIGDLNHDDDDDDVDGQPSLKKRGKQRTLGDGLPTYFLSLIYALVDDKDADPSELYENALDVFKDLDVASKKQQFCSMPEANETSLVIPNAFYGRRNELALLTRSLQTVSILGKNSVAVVSGPGGTGKTTLINQIKKPVQDVNGYFIEAKFDLNAHPDYVIVKAIDSFIEGINDDEEGLKLKARIKDSLCSAMPSFENSMPNLSKLIGKSSSATTVSSELTVILHQQEQMKSILCSLIGSISSRKNPIVIFLDDLQWADETSLDIIHRIVVSPTINYCFFLASYRDNDSTLLKPLESMFDKIQSMDNPVTKVSLGGLDKNCTLDFVSETLYLPPNLNAVNQLASIIHHKTGGLALYIKSFLFELQKEDLLCFDLSRRWQFDLDKIRSRDVSNDVVEYLMLRIARLPRDLLIGLRIASCLGFSFDISTFYRAMDTKDVDLDELIQVVESSGFIQRLNRNRMQWVHDNVQQAAYNMIPSSKVASLHLIIGGRLLMRTPKEDRDTCVFDIVEQMNKGRELIKTPELKHDSAQLNLHAGRKSMSSLSFYSAAKYFDFGIKTLGDEFWTINYDLTLSLHHGALEALFAIRNYQRMGEIVEYILVNATCLEDEIDAHLYEMRVLISVGKANEILGKSKDLLRRLGEPLPNEITKNLIIQEFLATKEKLSKYEEKDLLALSEMSDRQKLAAMQVLSFTVNAAIRCQPRLIPLLTFRGMNLTLDHGVSSLSASCIATYGCWLVNQQISKFEEGFRMGQIATKLMDRLREQSKPRVFVSVYGLINIWRQPFHACLDMLSQGYKLGMKLGDISNALGCLAMHGQMTWCCGTPLQQVINALRLNCKNAIVSKEMVYAQTLVEHLQMALSLTGSSEDAYHTYFKQTVKDYEHCYLQKSVDSIGGDYTHGFRLIPFRNKHVLFLKDGPTKEIKEWFELGEKVDETSTQILFPRKILGFFIDGMIGFSFARIYDDNQKERWREIGNDSISKFKLWSENSEWNFINKLHLLLAERYFLEDDKEKAIMHYEKAIKAAGDHHFLHEEGLANVSAAKCCLHYGEINEALKYYKEAKACYIKWGATALVECIDTKCNKL